MGGALINVDVIFERDLAVPMRDGVTLSANLFRPADGKRVPVVMSVTPYGKDKMRVQDFPVGDRPISRVGDHLTGSLAEPKATILTLPSSCWQACAP